MTVVITPQLSGCPTDICAGIGRVPTFTTKLSNLQKGLNFGSPSEAAKNKLKEMEVVALEAFGKNSSELNSLFPGYTKRFDYFYSRIKTGSLQSNDEDAKFRLFLDSVLETIELLKTLKL